MKRNHILLSISVILIVIIIIYGFLRIDLAHAPTASEVIQTSTDQNYPTLASSTATVTLKLGEHIMAGTVLFTPTSIVSDSRCATGFECINGGTVVLAVNASSEDDASVIDLALGKSESAEGYTITLDSVAPAPHGKGQINPSDYSFTITISRNIQ